MKLLHFWADGSSQENQETVRKENNVGTEFDELRKGMCRVERFLVSFVQLQVCR